jgi:hypothetical protein
MVHIMIFPKLNILYFYISTLLSTCAVPSVAVFCGYFMSRFSYMLFRYFFNDFEMVSVAPVFTGINLVFTFHIKCIGIVRSVYFKIFLASFLITFLSREMATY